MKSEPVVRSITRTGGRPATQGLIEGQYALSVGMAGRRPPEGWRWTRLSDVARLESGHTPSRKKPEYWGGDIPWIGVRDATGNHGRVLFDTEQHTNALGIANSSARLLPAHTVCLSRTASVGYVVAMGRPMATSQDFVNWVCGENIDWRFLMYVLLAEHESYSRFAHGTTHQTIYFPEVKAFHVCLPPITEQRRIAGVLGVFDGKIEHNQTLAARLREAAAGFVDAELANADGGASVYDFASVTYGAAYKSSLFGDEGLPVIRIRDLATHAPGVRTTEAHPKSRLVEAGDIVVGMDGEFRAYLWHGPRSLLNQRVCVLDPSPGISRAFLWRAIQAPLAYVEATEAGTTVIHLGKADINGFELPQPSSERMAHLVGRVDPMIGLSVSLERQAQDLALVRDALLPKLVSGQIRVPEDYLPGDLKSAA